MICHTNRFVRRNTMEQSQTEVQDQTAIPSPDRDDRAVPFRLGRVGCPHRFPAGLRAPEPHRSNVGPQRPHPPGFTPSARLRRASRVLRRERVRPGHRPSRHRGASPTGRHSTPCSPTARTATWLRQLCCVMTIEGMETYLLTPRDPADSDLLVEAVRPSPAQWIWMSSLA